jgi:hypothetical protein
MRTRVGFNARGNGFQHAEFICRFFWESGMSKRSKNLRGKAAYELRKSRNGGSRDEKAKNVKRAAAYKSLSESEEWLEGEKHKGKLH